MAECVHLIHTFTIKGFPLHSRKSEIVITLYGSRGGVVFGNSITREAAESLRDALTVELEKYHG